MEPASSWIRIALFIAFVAWIFIDLLFDDYFLVDSARVSARLQDWGKDTLNLMGVLFTNGFAYIPVAFTLLVFVLSKSQMKALYYFCIFYFGNAVIAWLKALFYKGRPWAVHDNLRKTKCEPGLPSGHCIYSIVGYYTIYHFLTDEGYVVQRWAKNTMIAVFGVIMTLIILSRISLGDHSYNQVIMGILLGLNIITNGNFDQFSRFIKWVASRPIVVFVPLLILNYGFFLLFGYVNLTFRENYSLWTQISPKYCNGTFMVGMAKAHWQSTLLFGGLLFFPYARVMKHNKSTDAPLTIGKILLRIGVHSALLLLLMVPQAAVSALEIAPLDNFSRYVWMLTIAAINWMLCGFLVTRLSKYLLECFRLNTITDYLHENIEEPLEGGHAASLNFTELNNIA